MRRLCARDVASTAAALAVVFTLAGCGGGSSPTAAPTPLPTPTPPPPKVVLQSSYAIELNYVYAEEFSISGAGTVDLTVDYTYSDSQIVIWLAKTPCSFEQLAADQCQFVASSFAGPKPRKVSATGLAAGRYELIIWNAGPHDEGVSYQAVFTQTSTAAAPGVTALRNAGPSGFSGCAPRGDPVGRDPRLRLLRFGRGRFGAAAPKRSAEGAVRRFGKPTSASGPRSRSARCRDA